MPATNFNDAILRPNGTLVVGGPFETHGKEMLGRALVRFVLVQVHNNPPRKASVLLNPAFVDAGADHWEQIVEANEVTACGIEANKPTRAIGIAVLVTQTPGAATIPAFETLTWCQDIKIKRAP